MGDRYCLDVTCPHCGAQIQDVYFAPTCGFTDYVCLHCGKVIDLIEYTSITAEDASNTVMIQGIIDSIVDNQRQAGGGCNK